MGLIRHRIQDEKWDYFEEIFLPFQSFNFYVDEVSQLIDREIKQAKESYKKFAQKLEVDPTWEDEWVDNYLDFQTKISLNNIYYDSLIMTLYSFLEKKMFFLCNYLSQEHVIKVDDVAGNGIFKYHKYLSKVCGINLLPIEQEWEIIRGYNKLRNHIVHSEGIRSIPNTKKELISFLKNINGVILTEKGNAISFDFTTDDILRKFIVAARTIIDHIYSEKVRV